MFRSSTVVFGQRSPIAVWLSMGGASCTASSSSLHRGPGLGRTTCGASTTSARYEQKRYFSAGQPDFYRTLGVKNDATHDEVKAAYKKLALEFHPDRNKAEGAEDKFKQISEAYSVIGNKSKRKDYDSARSFGTAGFASSQNYRNSTAGTSYSSGGSGTGYTSSGGPNYGSGFGQTFTGSPFTQHAPPGGQQVRYERMSTDEANRLFRDLFGGQQVDQIFRDFEQHSHHRRTMGGGFQPRMQDFPAGQHSAFRPSFREDASKVYTDEFGNRTEERTFTSTNGTKYTVRNTSSAQEGASSNHTAEEFFRNAAGHRTSQDGRAQFGTSSFQFKSPNRDFGQFFNVRTHGRHPLVAIAIIIGWSVVITTVFFGVLNFAVSHPIFIAALFMLYFARKGRF